MKIITLTLNFLILFGLMTGNLSCKRDPASIIKIVHEEPVEGVRITQVRIDRPDQSVILRFDYKDQEEPKSWIIAAPQETITLKIVTIEQLNGVFAWYLRKNGLSHHETLEIPENYQVSHMASNIPTPEELISGMREFIEFKWRDIEETFEGDNIAQFFTVSIGYSERSQPIGK